MFSKLDKKTFTSKFESHSVPNSYGLVPHLSQKRWVNYEPNNLLYKKLVKTKLDKTKDRTFFFSWNIKPKWILLELPNTEAWIVGNFIGKIAKNKIVGYV